MREDLQPHAPKEIWLSGSAEPTTWVNVSSTIDIKLAALREHKSQIKKPEEMEKRIRERLLRKEWDEDLYAEAFRVIRF